MLRFFKATSLALGVLLAASSASALECTNRPRHRGGWYPPYRDPRCASSCFGFCHGYYYIDLNLNYFNPNCADVCC